jgi:hypothetical protein
LRYNVLPSQKEGTMEHRRLSNKVGVLIPKE